MITLEHSPCVTAEQGLVLKHSTKGRSRFFHEKLYRNRGLQQRLETGLVGVNGVLRVHTNPRTGSLLVHYRADELAMGSLSWYIGQIMATERPSQTHATRRAATDEHVCCDLTVKPRKIKDHWFGELCISGLRTGFMGYRFVRDRLFNDIVSSALPHSAGMISGRSAVDLPYRETPQGHAALVDCVGCNPPPKRDLSTWIKRYGTFLPLTGLMGYQLVREYYYKQPVSQSPLSLTGIVAMIAAVPLLREAWKETFEEKRFTIHQFLAFSLVLGIFMGEALAAFEIIYILRLGMLLEEYVANRSRRAIRNMLEVSVKDAHVFSDGKEIDTPIEQLRRGDVLVVRTGQKVPVDGEIEKGEALLNESSITGRSEAIFKDTGSAVFAGSYMDKGVVYVRALKVGGDTYLARIASLVEASLNQKAPLQQRADELAAQLLKLGTLATLSTWVITQSVSRAFSVMIVMSCPCATILAASTAVSAALHNAARRQVLVKGGVYLEKIADADVYCFDKTGTITTEEPLVASVVSHDERDLLFWAASAELHNPHALAGAVLRHAEALGVEPEQHSMSEHILGNGIKATVNGCDIMLGNQRMMSAEAVELSEYEQDAQRLIAQGQTAVYVVRDRHLLGVIGIKHRLRSGAEEVVNRLRVMGVKRIYLISGDERLVAEGLSNELALDACYAEVLPEEKAQVVNELRRDSDALVVMVGDGVNDALALSESDIGIAMVAGGSEFAIEVADIALADSDIWNLVYVRGLSKATLRIAKQNYYLAVGTNLAGIALGAVGWLNPAMAWLIHISHTLGIMLNSARLIRARPT